MSLHAIGAVMRALVSPVACLRVGRLRRQRGSHPSNARRLTSDGSKVRHPLFEITLSSALVSPVACLRVGRLRRQRGSHPSNARRLTSDGSKVRLFENQKQRPIRGSFSGFK